MSKETGKKRKRITLSIEDKVNIIKLIETGTSYVISTHYRMRDWQCATLILKNDYQNTVYSIIQI